MVQFGRRIAPPPGSIASAAAIEPGEPAVDRQAWLTTPALPGRAPPWVHFVLLALLLPIGVLMSLEWSPRIIDNAPGGRFMAPGFAVPPGCPARRWAADDYMPRACAQGPAVLPSPDAYGLQSGYRTSRRHYHRVRWVRTGPDAEAVQCALFSCRVWAVERLRFWSPPGTVQELDTPDSRDYRAKPWDYLLAEVAPVAGGVAVAAAALVLLLLRRRARRIAG